LLFLQDKDARINKKKGVTGKARASEKFLRQQRRKRDRGNACAVLLASNTTAAREHIAEGSRVKDEKQLHCLLDTDDENGQAFAALIRGLTLETETGPNLGGLEDASFHSFEEIETFMSEIQLRGIVDKMTRESSSQGTDGDEVMTKNGAVISKFARDALEIGATVGAVILDKVGKVFDLNWGDDAVFRVRNGAPKIMTKFKNKPYSYELLPEYVNGSKKFIPHYQVDELGRQGRYSQGHSWIHREHPSGSEMSQPTQHLKACDRSQVLSPGQAKDDPDHGFRVCVNDLINKCIKPDASTIPLAVDEIKNFKYLLQLDGANAYWSIPVCEESMRLTAFHTPDGIYCWNRLLMGAKPSSAVQQSAYLQALDHYIDYYEDGTLRKCLLNEHGNRLREISRL
jgi:hypothetical protein